MDDHAMATGDTIGFENDGRADANLLSSWTYDERGRVVASLDTNLGRLNAGLSPVLR